MIRVKVIVIGGGPAGASCAMRLKQYNVPALILDKHLFPRHKTCAGWITPKVVRDLDMRRGEYPYSWRVFNRLNYYVYGYKIPIRTRQYAIRRFEFDRWLIERAGVPVAEHHVKKIRKTTDGYIIDDTFCCEYLVGAGGTNCCVYRTFFKTNHPRKETHKIVALEEEFPYGITDPECHLWFFENRLPGYAWYVPKGNGYLNVGIGGKYHKLRQRGESIHEHWKLLVEKLAALGLVKNRRFRPRGSSYYLRGPRAPLQSGKAFLLGDAAGLATVDMGEGIGAAVQSGTAAAAAIATGKPYTCKNINRLSLKNILFSGK